MSATNAAARLNERVSIYLKNSKQYVLAKFGVCVVDFFGFSSEGLGYVGLEQEKDRFVFFKVPQEDPRAVLLKHAVECPALVMQNKESLCKDLRDRGVGMGVAVLLSSSDQCVLVTRRAAHMRTFPGVWVPPGGHVEPGESLLEAGLRELWEETGLKLEDTSHDVLGLWESVYPHKLELGDPIRQHIVIYLVLQSRLSSQRLSELLKLQPEETDAAMWLPFPFVEKLSTGNSSQEIPTKISVIQHVEGKLEYFKIDTDPIVKAVAPPADSTQIDIDRLTWGTRFALQQWTKWSIKNKLNTSDSKL